MCLNRLNETTQINLCFTIFFFSSERGCTGALQVAIVPATLRCFCAYGGLWFILCVYFMFWKTLSRALSSLEV